MKSLRKILVLLVLIMPFTVNALENNYFTTVAGDNVSSDNDVNGSSVLAGNTVEATNNVDGINMLFGNTVNHKSNSDYAVIAGNVVNVSGIIENDGFIFGNLISFEDNFQASRDVFVFGNTVTLKGNINRDITIYAASVILENVTIGNNVTIYSTTLEVKDNVQINGTLSYNSDNETNISTSATIAKTELLEKLVQTPTIKDTIYTFMVDYAGMMIIFLALAIIVPSLFKRVEKLTKEISISKLFSLFGFGAFLLIIIPVLVVMLFTTTITTPLAILALLIYIIIIWLSNLFAGYFLGTIIWEKFIKKENNVLLIGLVGISIISILQMIPVIGTMVTFISLFVGLGIVLQLFKRD